MNSLECLRKGTEKEEEKILRESPLVKICGLTDPHEAKRCVELGADAIGLVFYEKSPRHLSMDQAKKITALLPPTVITIGVFVNADHDYIMERVVACSLKAVQLHGQESPELATTAGTVRHQGYQDTVYRTGAGFRQGERLSGWLGISCGGWKRKTSRGQCPTVGMEEGQRNETKPQTDPGRRA